MTLPLARRAAQIGVWRTAVDWPAVGAFALPFLLYLRTLAPTVYNLDSAELTTAAATGGLVRATGYPLYLILGKLWALLPLGDVGFRLNLFAAFCGALTILQAEFILRRLKVSGPARAGALGLLATAPYFWSLSLAAEVYTLHTALLAGVLLLLLRWADRPTARGLWPPALLLTLSLGNHAATVLLLPGVVWFVATTAPQLLRRPRTWAWLLTAVLLGLTPFLYLPLRYLAQPAFNYAGHFAADGRFIPVDLTTWPGLWWLIGGVPFAGNYFGYPATAVPGQWTQFSRWLAEAFLVVGVGPGLLGAVVKLRRDWRVGGLLLLVFLAHTIFFVNYRAVDKETMFLPSFFVWALWLGVGYQELLGWLRPLLDKRPWRLLPAALLLLPVLVTVVGNWPRVNLADDWSTRRQSEMIFATVAPDALIVGWWETVPALQYLQLVEGQRPDVLLINRFLIDGPTLQTLIAHEVTRRPVYLDSPPLPYASGLHVTPAGPLFRLHPPTTAGSLTTQEIKPGVNSDP